VAGFALPPETEPNLFDLLGLSGRMLSCVGDIRHREEFAGFCRSFAPQVIFHLAAQPLVRRSYAESALTFETNVMGTVSVLEAAREASSSLAVVCVTSDKCYENQNWRWGYRESDPLGGHDPYSASKAAAEIVVQSYRRSFLSGGLVRVASARAGNVIGGGDWSEDRLLADAARSLANGAPLLLRQPHSTRPWQHVLEPLAGYLALADKLRFADNARYESAFNFGPRAGEVWTTCRVVSAFFDEAGTGSWSAENGQPRLQETAHLALDSAKAEAELDWHPVWSPEEAIRRTARWYRDHLKGRAAAAATDADIDDYERASSTPGSENAGGKA
jgi:CDP-glucose 4,6-dehydratase